MRATFLFWNIQKTDLRERIARIVSQHSVDLIALAESRIAPVELTAALNRLRIGTYSFPISTESKIQICTRWDPRLVRDEFRDALGRLTIRRVHIGPPPGFLFVGGHLPSKVNRSDAGQSQQVQVLADHIRRTEERNRHERTILAGDLNMNPFEHGIVGATGLHAVMTRSVAAQGAREVDGIRYPYFYNPMWAHFGDRTDGPPGTHFYRSGEPILYFWNMFDQLLIRPALMEALEFVRILDTDGQDTLLAASGIPDKNNVSDHLPLLFALDL